MAIDARRVLLVEDEAMSRTLLTDVVRAAGYDVVPCADAKSAMKALRDFDPDAVITDIDLGTGPSGLDLIVALDKTAPYLAFVILSNYTITPDYRHAALGRAAYLRKHEMSDTTALLSALEGVLQDQEPRHMSEAEAGPLATLTAAQVQVLRMIAEGKSNDEIARRRGTTVKSVEHMITRLFQALDLTRDPTLNMRVAAARIYLNQAGRLHAD